VWSGIDVRLPPFRGLSGSFGDGSAVTCPGCGRADRVVRSALPDCCRGYSPLPSGARDFGSELVVELQAALVVILDIRQAVCDIRLVELEGKLIALCIPLLLILK